MRVNIFARTAPGGSYPQYVSVNETSVAAVEVTVRSPAGADGCCGATAAAVLSKDEALELARSILEKYGTL